MDRDRQEEVPFKTAVHMWISCFCPSSIFAPQLFVGLVFVVANL